MREGKKYTKKKEQDSWLNQYLSIKQIVNTLYFAINITTP